MYNTILAFDSSISNCSVALLHKNNIYRKNKLCNKNQTKYILPMIKQLLIENYITLNEIDIILISKGPGNFIGTRTTIAVAQGLALGLKIPIIAFPTTLIMAEQAWKMFHNNKVLVLLKINNSLLYVIQYVKNEKCYWTQQTSEIILSIEQTIRKISTFQTPWIIVGNSSKLFLNNVCKHLIVTNIAFPQSEFIISLYLSHKIYQNYKNSYKISPMYYRQIIY
ncbi:MAG: tRNA (adenosine(37)-N6)-threonylcarbamoyltransferase complex dimerization subunit type 1 TsaB [Buchnera aphidicola (Meitanaphis flavogallis)]